MKIIVTKKYLIENLKENYPDDHSLPKRLTPEEASEQGINVYINNDWNYVIKGKAVNFIFYSVINLRHLYIIFNS